MRLEAVSSTNNLQTQFGAQSHTDEQCASRWIATAARWCDPPQTQICQPLMYHQTDLICIDLSSFVSCSSVLHEEYLQSHLFAEPHHHVCDPAAPDLLHGSHEHHPGVLDRRRPQQRCVLLLAQMVRCERLLYMFNI